jgi:hypothetical protein
MMGIQVGFAADYACNQPIVSFPLFSFRARNSLELRDGGTRRVKHPGSAEGEAPEPPRRPASDALHLVIYKKKTRRTPTVQSTVGFIKRLGSPWHTYQSGSGGNSDEIFSATSCLILPRNSNHRIVSVTTSSTLRGVIPNVRLVRLQSK